MKNAFVAVVFSLITPGASLAQSHVPIYINANTPDMAGGRLLYAIKEGIRRSSSMKLADRKHDALIWINLVTMDSSAYGTKGVQTIYSATWTMQTFHNPPVTMYLENSVGLCGTDRVHQCADSLVADTDEQVTAMRAALRSIIDTQKK